MTSRYDQGFLTKVDRDIKFVLDVLERRSDEDESTWQSLIDSRIDTYFRASAPTRVEIEALLKRGRHSGAMQKALLLPMTAHVRRDLLDPAHQIGFPDAEPGEIHHFFPTAWCASNKHIQQAIPPDEEGVEFNLPNSIVNLIPLSRASNNYWKARHPAQVVVERNLSFDGVSGILGAAFIDRECFELATGVDPDPVAFWNHRARLYGERLVRLMRGV